MILSKFKVCCLYCWVGEFPWYFPFFLKTCEYNKTINFIIISNQPPVKVNSTNILFIYKTLEEINNLATEKLGFKTSIDYAYKLCDFKPAYATIFSEYIQGYDFWAYGDIDVIFGDIRTFITDDLLSEYDVISTRGKYLPGYFSLFRNTSLINSLYQQSKDFKLIFQGQKHYCFDECNFQFQRLQESEKTILDIQSEVESFTHVVKKAQIEGKANVFFDHWVIDDVPGNLEWRQGKLFYNNKFEALLYHLIMFKDHPYLNTPEWVTIPDNFFINEFFFCEYAPSTLEGQDCIQEQLKKRQVATLKKLEKYSNCAFKPLDKYDLENLSEFLGIYRFLSPSDKLDFYLQVEIKNGRVFMIFPDNSTTELQNINEYNFLATMPNYYAEVSFRYDSNQLTQSLMFLPLGGHQRKYLHKLSQKPPIYVGQ
jgi:hypothetical protein